MLCFIHICTGNDREITCDFDDSYMCGYVVDDAHAKITWKRHMGSGSNLETGPKYDHQMSVLGR